MSNGSIDGFLARVRARLDRIDLARNLLAALVLGAGAMCLVALGHLAYGYAVPRLWYLVLGGATLLGAVGWQLAHRHDLRSAAGQADRHFGLHDGLTSWLGFSRRSDANPLYALHERQLGQRIADQQVSSISWHPMRGLAVGALFLGVLAIGAGFIDESEAVTRERRERAETLAKTEIINKQLKEMIEELDRPGGDGIDDDEEGKDLKKDLKKFVDKLKDTENKKDAFKQYAKLERQIRKKLTSLERKKDEALLKKAAEKLKDAPETKDLGKKLDAKKFKDAAKDLKDLGKIDPKKLTEAEKKLAKLKAAAQRLAAAARQNKQNAGKGQAGAKKNGKNDGAAGAGAGKGANGAAAGEGAEGGAGDQKGKLSDKLMELEDAVNKADKALDKILQQTDEFGEADGEAMDGFDGELAELGDDLDDLQAMLGKLDAQAKARARLRALQSMLAKSQGALGKGGMSALSKMQSDQAGGNKAGKGSSDKTNTEKDPEQPTLATKIKGLKGSGPSTATVEDADSGTGTSSRHGGSKARDYKRVMESFVHRDDIPDAVKDGVKEYFETIHQNSGTTNDSSDSDR